MEYLDAYITMVFVLKGTWVARFYVVTLVTLQW